ncbi:TetR/AcrR family transcriptional regulator C-terminal domain-containing protein [Phytohabitans aurantiacus]|uniref:GntR family transcriptional regulator n=1 Tax=Phytohabitans aurantiacus TaxID=3016789 RepID=A0ABQ5R408_9ACTN|nr:TetR/AcrR family transcriptional regulator C-terminal domain-containing protein [Phytohabitans aurantiacus]GLI01425.1 GntR family transcriptional regulator [Phytohabitans aurantiacus]
MEQPYQRIVADIRDRIDSGRLRPGDRVPSTRQIVRDWGVAMATATRAIAALREAGLVDTRPGAGTTVRHPHQKGERREPELSRDRIVRTAVALADAEGLAMLSMRRIAADLDVATMTLYRYVASKEELVLAMVDAVHGESPLPARPPHWRAALERAARLMWTVFRRHPWAAEALSMTRPQLLPNVLAYADFSLATLRELGLDVSDTMHIHLTLFGHVRGTALNIQSEVRAEQDTGLTSDEWIETQRRAIAAVVATGRFPAFAEVSGHQFDYDLDAVFEYGLQRLLDGVAAHVDALRASAAPRVRAKRPRRSSGSTTR